MFDILFGKQAREMRLSADILKQDNAKLKDDNDSLTKSLGKARERVLTAEKAEKDLAAASTTITEQKYTIDGLKARISKLTPSRNHKGQFAKQHK